MSDSLDAFENGGITIFNECASSSTLAQIALLVDLHKSLSKMIHSDYEVSLILRHKTDSAVNLIISADPPDVLASALGLEREGGITEFPTT